MYPARYPEIISVGASTPFGELASYSNFGEEMDVMAPGSNVVSVDVTNGHVRNGFGVCSGTSQAASHVTAAAALMLSLDPTLGPKKLKNILLETSTITAYGPAGEINLAGALERIIEMGQN
jgi:subtilisin family serine protease